MLEKIIGEVGRIINRVVTTASFTSKKIKFKSIARTDLKVVRNFKFFPTAASAMTGFSAKKHLLNFTVGVNQRRYFGGRTDEINSNNRSAFPELKSYIKPYNEKYTEIFKAIEDTLDVLKNKNIQFYNIHVEFLQNLKAELTKLKSDIDTLDEHNFAQLLFLQQNWQLLQESVQDQLNELEATVNSRDKKEQLAKKYLTDVFTKLKQTFECNVIATEFYTATAQQLIQEAFESTHQAIRQLTLAQPKCFISYAWGITEHEQLATKLAAHLQLLGFEVWLDRWSNPAGAYIDYFTTKIHEADYVILLGSKKLVAKYKEGQALFKEVQVQRQQLEFSQNILINRNYIVNVELQQIFTKGLHSPGAIVPLLLDGTLLECLPPNNLQNVVPIHLTEHRDTKVYGERLFELVQVLLPNAEIKALVDTKRQTLAQRLALLAEHVKTKAWQQSLADYTAKKQHHQNAHQTAINETIKAITALGSDPQSTYQPVPGVHYFQDSRNKNSQLHLDNSPTLHGAKVYNLPVKNPNFTGRRELLAKIDHCLKSSSQTPQVPLKPVVLTACYGLGGIGKTQLATEYVYQHLADYSTIIWMDAENSVQIETAFHQLASQWQIAVESPQRVIEAVKDWLENHPGYLLVLDNVAAYEAIEPYLPRFNGQVLITSRYIHWPGTSITVDVFSPEEAQAYVKQLLPLSQDQEGPIALLIETLGYLPLALAQACAFIKENHLTLETYLRLYEKERVLFFKANVLPKGDKHLPVYVNWDMTLQVLPAQLDKWQLPAAIGEQLLTFCAYLQHTGIPTTLLQQYLKSQGIKEELKHYQVIGLLRNYSLLQEDQVAACCAIHPVMQEVLKLKASPKGQAAHLIAVYTCLKQLYPLESDDMEAIGLKRQLLPHLAHLLKQWDQAANLKVKEDELSWLLTILAEGYTTFGDAKRSKEILERALAIKEKHYGKDHWQVAITLTNLSNAYAELGDAAQQKVLLERALVIEEKHYGKDHWQVAITLNNLANAYGDLGDAARKKVLLERALSIKERHYGKEHWQVAITLNNLGNAYGALGDAAHKKVLLERALPILEVHYGKDHVVVASTLENLGNAYGALGDAAHKKVLLEQALAILEAHYGKDHVVVASTLVSLANAYGALGNGVQQKMLLERALPILEAHYGKDHVVVASTLGSLGNAYGALGDAAHKKMLLERALPILEAHYGKDHWQVAITLNNLGMAYYQLNEWSQAETYLLRALALFQATFGLNYINVADILISLSMVAKKNQQRSKAQAYLTQALAIPMRAYDLEAQAIQGTWAKLRATNEIDQTLAELSGELMLEKALHVFESLYQAYPLTENVLKILALFQLLLQDKGRFVAFIGLSSEQVALETTATDLSYSPRP